MATQSLSQLSEGHELKMRPLLETERAAFYARVAEIQAHVKELVPAGVSLVDELIAERRAETAREETEWTQGS